MKILLISKLYLYEVFGNEISNEYSPAGRRRILGFIEGLKNQGAGVDVLSPIISYPQYKFYYPQIKVKYGDGEICYPGLINIKYINYFCLLFSTFMHICRMHSRNKYNAIIFYNPLFYRAYPAIVFGKIKNLPVIMDYVDLVDSEYTSQKWARKILGWIEKHIVRLVDNFILASNNFKDLIGVKSKYLVIRSGCSRNSIDFDPPRRGNIDKDLILFSGKLAKVRGVDLLIEASKHIKSENYIIVITGNGPLMEYVKQSAQTNPRIVYKGFLSRAEYEHLLHKATILVNAQRTGYIFSKYCFPSKLYEYMSAGKFVISTNVSDVAEHLRGKIFILGKDEPKALADLIDYILKNKHALYHMQRNAQKYVKEVENWDQQAKRILEFLGAISNKALS